MEQEGIDPGAAAAAAAAAVAAAAEEEKAGLGKKKEGKKGGLGRAAEKDKAGPQAPSHGDVKKVRGREGGREGREGRGGKAKTSRMSCYHLYHRAYPPSLPPSLPPSQDTGDETLLAPFTEAGLYGKPQFIFRYSKDTPLTTTTEEGMPPSFPPSLPSSLLPSLSSSLSLTPPLPFLPPSLRHLPAPRRVPDPAVRGRALYGLYKRPRENCQALERFLQGTLCSPSFPPSLLPLSPATDVLFPASPPFLPPFLPPSSLAHRCFFPSPTTS